MEEKLNLKNMIKIFEDSNKLFLKNEKELINSRVSERAWYTRLAIYFNKIIEEIGIDKDYFVDTEYNRNLGKLKTILDDTNNYEILEITCDFLLHSRGNVISQDNLICIEMKKSTAKNKDKEDDKKRVRILTKDSSDDVWSGDGKCLPEHVCRYILGIYYEINIRKKEVYIEYYNRGKRIKNYILEF